MTELEYVTVNFGAKFSGFRGSRIVLHGSRNYAAAILERYDGEFGFQGILTDDPQPEGTFRGKPVLTLEDLPRLGTQLVILTERVRYAEAAYRSIRGLCLGNGIGIFNMYGLDEIAVHAELEACGAVEDMPEGELDRLTDPYDVVAFELMDTFLMPDRLTNEAEVREPLRKLFLHRRRMGMPVYFSLRKSFSEEEQADMLWRTGLFRDRAQMESLLIRRRGEDLSFRAFRGEHAGRILYMGSGLVNECILPRCYGIDTYRIWQDLVPHTPETRELPDDFDLLALRERLRREIAAHDVISFDVFDTLLVRRTLRPEDVFELTGMRLAREGLDVVDYARHRLRAQTAGEHLTLEEICRGVCERVGLPASQAERLAAAELEAERDVLLPRESVAALLEEAKRAGKTVLLVSDMYIPARDLRRLLADKGITAFDDLLVSCDRGLGKREGLIREAAAAFTGRSFLHVGDSGEADLCAAREAGVDAVLLPSALSLAFRAGWEPVARQAATFAERCLVGCALARVYADPFQPRQMFEADMPLRLRHYGFGALGPVLAGFLSWLAAGLARERYDCVIFLGRDGYLLRPAYERLRTCFPQMDLPRSVYFHMSRHAAFLAVAGDLAGRLDRVSRLGLSPREYLVNVLDLPAGEVGAYDPAKESEGEYFARYADAVRERSREARAGVAAYTQRCGIRPGDRCVMVDAFAWGTIQKSMEQALDMRFRGLYLGKPLLTACPQERVTYYLRFANRFLQKNFMETESFLTAPEPALDTFTPDGEPVFQPEVRSPENLADMREGQKDINMLFNDFFGLFYTPGDLISSALTEEMYAAEGYHFVRRESYDDWTKKGLDP